MDLGFSSYNLDRIFCFSLPPPTTVQGLVMTCGALPVFDDYTFKPFVVPQKVVARSLCPGVPPIAGCKNGKTPLETGCFRAPLHTLQSPTSLKISLFTLNSSCSHPNLFSSYSVLREDVLCVPQPYIKYRICPLLGPVFPPSGTYFSYILLPKPVSPRKSSLIKRTTL